MSIRSFLISLLVILAFFPSGRSQVLARSLLDEHLVKVDHIPFPNPARVEAILRDRRGFMWFGTPRGLCKYDGYQIRIFTNDSPPTTEQNSITAMIELPGGEPGSLLLGTLRGLWIFDLQTEEFERFVPDGELSVARISALVRDAQGTIWIGTESLGLFAFDSTARRYTKENGLSSDAIECLYIDHLGVVWIGMYGGAFQAMDSKTSRIVHSGISIAPNGAPTRRVVSFAEDKYQKLWIGTDDGMGVINRETGTIRRVELPSRLRHTVHALSPDPAGRLWIGASDLELLFLADGAFSKISSADMAGIESQSTVLYVDPLSSDSMSVLLWVGTRNGVKKIGFARNPFSNHIRNRNGLVLDRGAVLALCEDQSGILWVGLWGGGLEGLRYENGRYTRVCHFEHDRANPLSLPDHDINPLYEDRHRRLWIGTGGGLATLDAGRRRMTVFRYNSEDTAGLPAPNITAIVEDRSGAIWVATYAGLSRLFSEKPARFKNFLHDTSDAHPYGGNKVSWLHVDRNGTLWAATFGRGLNKHNGDGTFTRILCPLDPTGYYQNFIYSIHEDSQGVFWLSVREGLASYDPESDKWETYRIDGLHNEHIYDIWVDRDRNAWLSAGMGLARFNPATGSFLHYGQQSGMGVSRLFSEFAHTSRGKLVVGGLDGFAEFSPDDLVRSSVPPQIAITSVAIFDTLLSPSLLSPKDVQLGYHQNFLTISFAVLDYTNPQRNGFAYRMEGVDEDWVHVGPRNYVTYAHLDPGRYMFQVKGYNSDHMWNEAGTSITFTIAPPFWETWWFRSFITVLIIGTTYAAYRYRLQRLLEVERLRLRIADDLHDDVGSNLSSISLGSHLALQRPMLDAEARQLIEEIRENAAHTAETMRDIVWLINPKNDQFEDMILRMRDVAGKTLNGIEHTFIAPDGSLPRTADLSMRRNIFLIYKESLTNIGKHANASKVEISLTHSDKQLVLSIVDNGVGFDLSAPRKGNGVSGFQRRADVIGAKLEMRSVLGKGTTVMLSVPVA